MNVTAGLRRLLRDRHPPPDWCLAFEVQATREDGGLRFADAIAFDTRKGAGMAVHGFELKVSRADWLNEVRDPTKADAGRTLCDFWWIVAGDPGIVPASEVPKGVGLLIVDEGNLAVATFPAHRNPRSENTDLERSLVAALLRRLDPLEPRSYWEARERGAEERGYAKGRNAALRVNRKGQRSGKEPATVPGEAFCP